MSDYNKITDYSAKDALSSGDSVKRVKGSEIGADFDAVAVAVATKANSASPVFTGVSGFAVGAVGAPSIYMTGYATTGWYNIGANNWGFAVSGAKVLDVSSTGLAVTGTLTATGVSKFAAGTVGAPSIYLSTDTTTGWYRIGANNVGFAVSGAKVLDIASTGLAVTGTLSCTEDLIVNSGVAATEFLILGNRTNTLGNRILLRNGSTHYAWKISTQDSISETLEITPSTAVGGDTFTTPIVAVSSTGLAVTGVISATGTSSLARIDQSNGSINFASLGNGSTSWQIGTVTALKPLDIFIGGSVRAQFSDTGLAVTGTTSTTSFFETTEIAAPAAGAANTARIFAVDNGSGKTVLKVQFATGAAQIIATEP